MARRILIGTFLPSFIVCSIIHFVLYLAGSGTIPPDYFFIVFVSFLIAVVVGFIPCIIYSFAMELLVVKLLSYEHGSILYVGASASIGLGYAGIIHILAEQDGMFGIFAYLGPLSAVAGLVTGYILYKNQAGSKTT